MANIAYKQFRVLYAPSTTHLLTVGFHFMKAYRKLHY
jgi:hypothetical protein